MHIIYKHFLYHFLYLWINYSILLVGFGWVHFITNMLESEAVQYCCHTDNGCNTVLGIATYWTTYCTTVHKALRSLVSSDVTFTPEA